MKQNKENFILLKEKGVSYKKIGQIYGISRQRVHQIISGYSSPSTIRSRLSNEEKKLLSGKKREEIIKYLDSKKIEKEKNLKDAISLIINKEVLLGNITSLTGIKNGSRDRIRELIRVRDNHTCQSCKKIWENGSRRFDVHHTNPEFEGKTFKLSVNDMDRKNLNEMITLCHRCHLGLPHNIEKMKRSKKYKK